MTTPTPSLLPITIDIPSMFYKDHINRGCGETGKVRKMGAKLTTVVLDEAAWIDLYTDADYYINMIGSEDYEGNEPIVGSAVRTMKRLKQAL